jgi:hypothetical protein
MSECFLSVYHPAYEAHNTNIISLLSSTNLFVAIKKLREAFQLRSSDRYIRPRVVTCLGWLQLLPGYLTLAR